MDTQKAIEKYENKLCNSLINEGATYSSIILTTEGKVLSNYSTNSKWENIYHESGLSKLCHLIKASKFLSQKSDNYTVFWDLVLPNNDESIYLNAKRNENNIAHGVSFCRKNPNGIFEVLSLAGRKSDINFASQVIKSKKTIEKYILEYKF